MQEVSAQPAMVRQHDENRTPAKQKYLCEWLKCKPPSSTRDFGGLSEKKNLKKEDDLGSWIIFSLSVINYEGV